MNLIVFLFIVVFVFSCDDGSDNENSEPTIITPLLKDIETKKGSILIRDRSLFIINSDSIALYSMADNIEIKAMISASEHQIEEFHDYSIIEKGGYIYTFSKDISEYDVFTFDNNSQLSFKGRFDHNVGRDNPNLSHVDNYYSKNGMIYFLAHFSSFTDNGGLERLFELHSCTIEGLSIDCKKERDLFLKLPLRSNKNTELKFKNEFQVLGQFTYISGPLEGLTLIDSENPAVDEEDEILISDFFFGDMDSYKDQIMFVSQGRFLTKKIGGRELTEITKFKIEDIDVIANQVVICDSQIHVNMGFLVNTYNSETLELKKTTRIPSFLFQRGECSGSTMYALVEESNSIKLMEID